MIGSVTTFIKPAVLIIYIYFLLQLDKQPHVIAFTLYSAHYLAL